MLQSGQYLGNVVVVPNDGCRMNLGRNWNIGAHRGARQLPFNFLCPRLGTCFGTPNKSHIA